MACGLREASSLGPHLLLLPHRRSTHQQCPHEVSRMDWFPIKLALNSLKSFNSKSLAGCRIGTSSGFAAKVAVLNRHKNVSTMSSCLDAISGTHIVISGYWTGPDIDDGCGFVEAMLDRIV